MKNRYQIKATCYDKRGRVLSRAYNSYTKTHPLQAHFAALVGEPKKQFLHAEIAAIIRAGEKRIHTIKIEGQTQSGEPKECKPCKICMAAIKAYDIKRIQYEICI